MVHGSLYNKAGEIWIHDLAGLVDCRSRVNKLFVSEDRTSKTAGSPVPSDRILPMYTCSQSLQLEVKVWSRLGAGRGLHSSSHSFSLCFQG